MCIGLSSLFAEVMLGVAVSVIVILVAIMVCIGGFQRAVLWGNSVFQGPIMDTC